MQKKPLSRKKVLLINALISALIIAAVILFFLEFRGEFFIRALAVFLVMLSVLILHLFFQAQIKQIRHQAKMLSMIIEKSPLGIYTINKEGVIDSFNPKMVELAGAKDARQVIGLNALELPTYQAVGLDKFFRQGLSGKSFETETRYLSYTGKKESFRHYFGVPLTAPDGKTVERLMLLVEDIGPRRRLEAEFKRYTEKLEEEIFERTGRLESLKEQYRAAVEGSLIGTYVLQENVLKYVNPAFLEIFGYKNTKEILGRPWWEFIPKEEKEKVLKSGLLERMKGRGAPRRYSLRVFKKDGRIIDVEILSNPSIYEGKSAVIGSVQDITERKKTEKELMESESKYRSLFDSLPVCVKVFDLSGNLIALNKEARYEHYLENVPDEKIRLWKWKNSIEKPLISKLESLWKLAIKGKTVSLEIKHVPGTSRSEYCFSAFVPVRKPSGEIAYILGYSTNITERKKSEARVRELGELKNKFIQIVSHQLRAPLSSIRWNLEAMLAEELGKLKKVQKEFLHISYEATSEVISRISDLLTALDIEEGRLVAITKAPSSLESLWGSVMVSWKRKCDLKKIKCKYERPKKPLPLINMDAERIRFVLEKLSENSLVYTKKGGRIFVSLRQIDEKARFEIKDNGIGIPASEQSRIFERFYRATNAPAMKPDASGLSLFIARYFVKQHGGEIGFESDEGGGSLFWFEMPI